MNCDRIQELILTDYADNRLSADQKTQLESHLTGCVHCREFAQVVREKILQPFAQAERLSPPESIWENIREEITAEEPVGSWRKTLRFLGSLQSLQNIMVMLSVFVLLATVTVLTLNRTPVKVQTAGQPAAAVTTLAQNKAAQDEFPAEQYGEEYLSYIKDEYAANYAPYDDGYGTAIEEYFL